MTVTHCGDLTNEVSRADEQGGAVLTNKGKPATVGTVLSEEFMVPIGLTQGALADAMGVQRKHVNELCNGRRAVTTATALMLARVFGNAADFWLDVQRRSDLWEAMNSPQLRARIERARPLAAAARANRRGPDNNQSGFAPVTVPGSSAPHRGQAHAAAEAPDASAEGSTM